MKSSATISKISLAFLSAQKEMSNAIKSADNPFFKKKYADLNSVREAVLPALHKHGMSVLQPTTVQDGKNYVETIILHDSGEWFSAMTEIITDKPNDAQRHGSGLSYSRRYGLASICNIGADDDDGNMATGKKLETTPEETPEQKAIMDIRNLVSLESLQAFWTMLPKELKANKQVLTAKDARKEQLSKGK
jgi:hypothetical protein